MMVMMDPSEMSTHDDMEARSFQSATGGHFPKICSVRFSTMSRKGIWLEVQSARRKAIADSMIESAVMACFNKLLQTLFSSDPAEMMDGFRSQLSRVVDLRIDRNNFGKWRC